MPRTRLKESPQTRLVLVMEGVGFEAWYRAEHPRVLGIVAALTGRRDLAVEATDEAFVRA